MGKPDLIRDIRRGKAIGSERLRELARVLETSTDYLLGSTDLTNRDNEPPRPIPRRQDMNRDLPVFGTALGASSDIVEEGEAIEQIDLHVGEVIDYFRRPPALRNRRDIYALYVQGDSMAPAYESGTGIVVDPKKPPALRDYVVVYLRGDADEAAAVMLKRLVRRSSEYIELEQYSPPRRFRLDKRQFRDVHRVIPWDEAFSI
jgi:phage repressor protein C with HTH and peptisase S24 domain